MLANAAAVTRQSTDNVISMQGLEALATAARQKQYGNNPELLHPQSDFLQVYEDSSTHPNPKLRTGAGQEPPAPDANTNPCRETGPNAMIEDQFDSEFLYYNFGSGGAYFNNLSLGDAEPPDFEDNPPFISVPYQTHSDESYLNDLNYTGDAIN